MRQWSERPLEVKYLLNSAFCGRIIYSAVSAYEKKIDNSMPFPLVYLILPFILHKNTRKIIDSRIVFTNWIQKYPKILIGFARRTKDLVEITNEAIEFLLQTQYLILNDNGELSCNKMMKKLSITRFCDDEVKECIKKAEHVGKWFGTLGKVENIYISLGVKP